MRCPKNTPTYQCYYDDYSRGSVFRMSVGPGSRVKLRLTRRCTSLSDSYLNIKPPEKQQRPGGASLPGPLAVKLEDRQLH